MSCPIANTELVLQDSFCGCSSVVERQLPERLLHYIATTKSLFWPANLVYDTDRD